MDDVRDPIKKDGLHAIAAVAAVVCVDTNGCYQDKKRERRHPNYSMSEAALVSECYNKTKEQLEQGPCEELYSEYKACFEGVFKWKKAAGDCLHLAQPLQECALRNKMGELADNWKSIKEEIKQ